MKPIRNSISYVVYNGDRSKFLIVLRPESDRELPNVWGLPAGNVGNGETFEDAVHRSLREKLGLDGRIVKQIGEGTTERDSYALFMKLYEVQILSGSPRVPQSVEGVTQYTQCRWGATNDLLDAASKGSLCCNMYLKSVNKRLRT